MDGPNQSHPLRQICKFDTSAWNADVDGEAARRVRAMDGPNQSHPLRQISANYLRLAFARASLHPRRLSSISFGIFSAR